MVLIRSTFLQIKFELNFKVEVLWNLTIFLIYLNELFHVVSEAMKRQDGA